MRYAKIESGIVENIVVADEEFAIQNSLIACNDDTSIGDLYDGQSFSKPPVEITPEFLEGLLESKKDSIRHAAETAYKKPVTLPDGSVWNGDMNSALAIDGAVRMAENAGLLKVSLYDHFNTEHAVDIAAGKSIAVSVASEYQRLFAIKQACMRQLDAIDLTSETAANDIEAVEFAH